MRGRFLRSVSIVVALAAGGAAISLSVGASPAQSVAPMKTPWGEPDLQGIWTDETDTPLQRSPKFANQEFFTEGQRAELDRERSAMPGREKRAERGTIADVAG